MSTKSQVACMACRHQKVKCVPGTRRCARCTALDIPDCYYVPVKKRGAGSTLRMGEACNACRKKKSKCDAKEPCTACVKRDGGAACTYERSRSSADVPPRHPSSPPREILLFASPDSSESGSSYFLHPDINGQSLSPPLKQLEWEASSDATVTSEAPNALACPPRPTVFSFEILPSLHFRTIPRPLALPSSVIPPECMQVSSVALNDLDMTFRLEGLYQLHRLGLYFTREKQDAILRGDTSNSVVHSNLVEGIQVMGMYFCAPEQTPAMIRLQARYVQRAWESLIHLSQSNREREKAQALVRVAHSAAILGLSAGAQLYLAKACKIIEKAKLRFLPEYGIPVEFSEQVREDASVLSQAIYLENYFYLTMGAPAPVKTTRIEREFRLDLQRVYPCLFEICPLTMRTQSILLVRDAIHALNSPVYQAENVSDRQRSCIHLAYALDIFSSDLMESLQQFINMGDTCGVWVVWTCCIICLAHLASLCHFISQTVLALSASMNGLYDLTLDKLGNLSLEVPIEKYSAFDLLTGTSWKTALDTIEARLRMQLDTENGLLGHCKTIIGKAYADFRENLPEFKPDQFVSLVFATDGRSDGSNFPNLIVPTERERFGI